jgi:serine/threonine protein kinase
MPKGNELSPLGSGVVTAVLGSGGMAKVYKIWNEKLEVNRAVKILLPSHRKESYKRFQTEAKISAKLHHPNIVEIHSIGDWNNLPFIEMELVEGDTLNAIISRFKVLPSIFCSAVAVHVARALEYAHSKDVLIYGKTYKGIIHRDLKPSNIIIGKHGIVKLMDFGVARPIATGLHTINVDTLIGTMHYFSPEQINGNSIDQLSDIYSFGAVLYEMLCGANPFPQSSMIELVRAKIKNQFTRLEDYHIPFDPRLASVAQICLRTDKSSRLESSVKLREQLELIHSSFEMGSPEEVIASFLRDPQAMYQIPEVNHYQSSIMQSIPEESETETITQNEIQVICKSEFPLISAEPDPLSVDTKAGPNKSQKNTIIILIATAVIVITTIILLTIVKPSLSFKPEFHKQITYSFNLQNVPEENALLTEVIEESNLAS